MPTTYDPSKDPLKATESGRVNPYAHTVEGVATVSPTGAPVIPPRAVPFLLLGAGLAQVIGDEVSNPAPWTLSRGIGLAVKVLSFLALGASPGLRRR